MNKKKITFIVISILLIAGLTVFMKVGRPSGHAAMAREVKPMVGSIRQIISSTGTVYPKNRLEIKPPVSGRVENVLVKEGEKVKAGQALAWMSSTERAALLDAASEQGEEKLRYWERIYKPIPLKAPIIGEVIVATTQPGQTVTTADAVIVLADKLIVRAQVDETDIGKIKPGRDAILTLDAYPDTEIKAKIEHIYYESQTVNNVIIYKVDLIPENVPEFFRSGMSVSVDFIIADKEDALILPVEAVQQDKNGGYVLVKEDVAAPPVRHAVKVGITEGDSCEIVSGVSVDDTVIIMTDQSVLPPQAGEMGNNPFLPKMPKQKKGQGGPPPL